VWIEGEAEPARDFAKLTIQAMHDIIITGRTRYPKLAFTVKEIVEDRDSNEMAPVPGAQA
jgi:hypothetical protein